MSPWGNRKQWVYIRVSMVSSCARPERGEQKLLFVRRVREHEQRAPASEEIERERVRDELEFLGRGRTFPDALQPVDDDHIEGVGQILPRRKNVRPV